MLRKVTHCAGRVLANARPHQLRWGDREMGTPTSCTECSQVAGLIQKLVETLRSKAPSLSAAVLLAAVLRAAVFRSKILRTRTAIVTVDCHMYVLSVRKRVCARACRGAQLWQQVRSLCSGKWHW